MTAADTLLNELDNEKSFRSIEIPEELLESILFIPAEKGLCPFVPIIKVERYLSPEQVKEMLAEEEENQYDLSTFKGALVRRDAYLLSELVATNYYSKIRQQKPDWASLYQVVEIDWTLKDLCPDQQAAIHYEIFTKREIFCRSDT
jgi:hypothetical protein